MPSDLREHDLRAFLEHMATEMPAPAEVPPGAIRRARTRLAGTAFGTAIVVAIALVGAVGGVRVLLQAEPDRLGGEDRQHAGPAWPGIWPQATRADAIQAQARADAEGVEIYWQSDWNQEGIVARRYLEEVLGWQVVDTGESYVPSDAEQAWEADVWERYFIRCEPGATNPIYPDDPRGGGCAPTIDATHYRQVVVRLEQLVRRGRGGIWLVTGWEKVEPYVQTVPPSASERADALRRLEAFLQARVAGSGAEAFLEKPNDPQVSFLYSMEDGRPYGAFEIRPGRDWKGPEWPFAGFGDVLVRLTPSTGDGCVIQVIRTHASGPDGEGDLLFSQFTGFSGFDGAFEPGSPECSAPLDESLLPPGTVVR